MTWIGALALANAWPLARPAQHGAPAQEQPANPDELSISATVDTATVDVGGSVTLTITIEGKAEQAGLEPFDFPEALRVIAQRRASNVSIRLGRIHRSTSLVYVLAAKAPGTVQLGPFRLTHRGRSVQTDPIEITVNKPTLPPHTEKRPRYVL